MADTLSGKKIGKYQIIEQLGRGGMAEVYKGYQENLDRYVAVKLMHAFLAEQQDFLQRFQREAKAMAAMNHPNIVGVYDFDVYGEDTYYLVMEYIDGGTLKEKIQSLDADGKKLPLEDAVRVALQVGEALSYAHERNMVHRDIKPANIMLDEKTGKAVLTDFGIVKLLGGQSMAYTATGALVGTPSYMSPEQALGKPGDERSDLYSLGVMLFQMTTGQLPFSADTPLAVVMKHVNDPIPMPVQFNPDVPQGLQDVILKALEKNPDYRFQSAREMVNALRAVNLSGAPATIMGAAALEGAAHTALSSTKAGQVHETAAAQAGNISATAVAPPQQAQKSSKKWLAWVIGIVAILLIGGSIGTFALINGRQDPTPTISAIVDAQETNTPTPELTATATVIPKDTPDIVATSVAAIQLTEEARATSTSTATPTATATAVASPTATTTPDTTATALANCFLDVELVNAYTYNSRASSSAPVNATFPMKWVLQNVGNCNWPDGLTWAYVGGEELGYDDDPVAITDTVEPQQEIELTAQLTAPAVVDAYESVWQLFTADGETFGPPLSFEIRTYIPATATPTRAPATATPAVSPTPELPEQAVDWIFVVNSCEDVGDDWRCTVTITPYGGGGGPYTVWVFDQPGGLATEYRGTGPFTYFAKARRCAAYNQEVKVQDDATGTSVSRQMYIDPVNYYSCTP